MPGDISETWGALLKVHAALVPRLDRELQEAHGLPLTWYDVLLELNAAPDRRLETLHVDLCAELPLFGRHPGAPGARETTATVQVPVYESLTDAQLHRVADVLRDAVRARDARTPSTVHASP